MTYKPTVRRSTPSNGAQLALEPTTPMPTSCWPGTQPATITLHLESMSFLNIILIDWL